MSQEEIDLYDELVEIGCCNRCILRCFRVDADLVSFEHPNTSLVNIGVMPPHEEFEPPHKIRKTNPCAVCLGLLQDEILDEILTSEQLQKALEFRCETFTANISFPPCITVRDHSLQIHLRTKFKNIAAEDIIKINFAWRCSIQGRLSTLLNKTFDSSSRFMVHFYFDYAFDDEELSVLQDSQGLLSKRHVNRTLKSMSDEVFSKLVTTPPCVPPAGVTFKEVICSSDSVHLVGNYYKYSRELMQLHNEANESVASIIEGAVRKVSGEEDIVFQASSFDSEFVRVMGTGRTFHLVLSNPKCGTFTKEICREIERIVKLSEHVRIKNLKEAPRKDIICMIDSEQLAPKTYKIVCIVYDFKKIDYCVNAINMYNTLTVFQKTPIRLLAARDVLVRKRKIYYIKARKIRGTV